MVMEVINVRFKQHEVGAVSFDTQTGLGAFEYAPSFICQRQLKTDPLTA